MAWPRCACPDNKGTRCLSASVIPIVCFLMMISAATLILLIELVLIEHLGAKGYVTTQCRVIEHSYTGAQKCSHCVSSGGYGYSHSDCYDSHFPCYEVRVRLTERNGTADMEEIGVLHSSSKQLKGQFSHVSKNKIVVLLNGSFISDKGPLTGVLMPHVDFKKCQCCMSLSLYTSPFPCRI